MHPIPALVTLGPVSVPLCTPPVIPTTYVKFDLVEANIPALPGMEI